MSNSETPYPNATENASLNIHRGAIDQTTVITTRAPIQVMERMGKHLQTMGMHVTQKGSFLYRCLYQGRKEESSAVHELPIPEIPPTDDRADVVRFTVELTQLVGLKDTYSLDIRRLRGSLRRYKQIYDDIRDRARSCAELNDPFPEAPAAQRIRELETSKGFPPEKSGTPIVSLPCSWGPQSETSCERQQWTNVELGTDNKRDRVLLPYYGRPPAGKC